MGNISNVEETSADCWVLYSEEEDTEFVLPFACRVDDFYLKDFLANCPDLIQRGFRHAYKRVTYEVHSLD